MDAPVVEAVAIESPPVESPRLEAKPLEVPPLEFASEPPPATAPPEESAPIIETPPPVAPTAPIAERDVEPAPIVEAAHHRRPSPKQLRLRFGSRNPRSSTRPPPAEPPRPLVPEQVAPPVQHPQPPVRPARETPAASANKPHLVAPVSRGAEPRLQSPPASAGMPTFKSVTKASGAPDVSPFEPPEVKDHDEARDLQEFVANFRYTPPDEAFDELTMRSEVPVVDAEVPAPVSHPSFDDDVAPPPEAGPHPTGQEYYPPVDPATGRSRYLDIAETRHTVPKPHPPASRSGSFLGLEDPLPPATQPLDRRGTAVAQSLAALDVAAGVARHLRRPGIPRRPRPEESQ